MSDNIIKELAIKTASPNKFSEDISEVIDILIKHFREKYYSGFEQAVRIQMNKAEENPTPEINLFKAIKPFISDKKAMDGLIYAFNTYNAISNIHAQYNKELVQIQAQSVKDDDIKNDGIYCFDEGCIQKKSIVRSMTENDEGLGIFVFVFIIILLLGNNFNKEK